MRKIAIILIAVLFLASCKMFSGGKGTKSSSAQSFRGELLGVKSGKSLTIERPFGTVLIPSGSFILGQTDYDFTGSDNAPSRTVTVNSFFMDDTEVTNSEYKQFVNYTRDSIILTQLADKVYDEGLESQVPGIGDYAYKNLSQGEGAADDAEDLPYYEYVLQQDNADDVYNTAKKINWDNEIIWDVKVYPDVEYTEILESMYMPLEDRFEGERIIDSRKLIYKYSWVDSEGAARAKGKGKRSDYVIKDEVAVYPDTTVWVRDFSYSYNDPMHTDYFWNPAYEDYPVVGVNWKQAQAFCDYRTRTKKTFNKSTKDNKAVFKFTLPSEVEWEYAARGGLDAGTYPWGGPYLTDDRGCFLANFKPKRGDYKADGFLYTTEAKSFNPNGYNLYNMSGNVSEWTSTSFDNISYEYGASMNPNLGSIKQPRKVIRGGSWKDVGYFLQVGTRDWEYADSARSYIGFRTIQVVPEGQKTTSSRR